jgi:hypothetical protein
MMAKKYIYIPIVLCLVLLVVAIPGWYISQEKFFYYWDYGGFQGVAIHQAEDFLKTPIPVLQRTIESTNLEYNYFYTIPLIPLIMVFGSSRLSYVLSVSLTFQLPFALTVGAIGALLIQFRRNLVFWSVVFLCLLAPIAWAPTLRGYPDVGGALFVALAVWIYCTNTRLDKWWQPFAIGGLLAGAILFRRHFTYDALAFFITIGILGVSPSNRKSNSDFRPLFIYVMKILIAGIVCISVLSLIARPLLKDILTTDYNTLFSSYALPSIQIFNFFGSSFGWVTWGLVGLGFSIGFATSLLHRPVAIFILLFNGISLGLWTIFARQVGIHYTLHITAFVILGLACFVWVVYRIFKKLPRLIIVSVFMLFVITNLIIGFEPVRLNSQMTMFRKALFSSTYAPLTRPDYVEVTRLVEYLRSLSPEGGTIYVVDSSERMNYDLLIKAEEALYDDQKLKVIVTPQIDSRDFYPLELLMQAEYVILTTPLQTHLSNPDEQKVVEVVFRAFTEQWEISQDFQELPEKFILTDRAVLSIYRRIRPTSTDIAVRTFAEMKSFIGRRPGKQPDWIILASPSSANVTVENNGNTRIEFPRKANELVPSQGNGMEIGLVVLFSNEVYGQANVQGASACLGLVERIAPDKLKSEIEIQIFDPHGERIQEKLKEISLSTSKEAFSSDFVFQEPAYVVVSVHRFRQNYPCDMTIEFSLTR